MRCARVGATTRHDAVAIAHQHADRRADALPAVSWVSWLFPVHVLYLPVSLPPSIRATSVRWFSSEHARAVAAGIGNSIARVATPVCVFSVCSPYTTDKG